MISLKRYLDSAQTGSQIDSEPNTGELLPIAVAAYRSVLSEMGNCSLDSCPALGDELKTGLGKLGEMLSKGLSREAWGTAEKSAQEQLQEWGRRTARHYQQKTGEVKEILILMAHTAESVGARDERCAQQISEVTTQLRAIANLEDLSDIRASIEHSASALKASIDRMACEGKTAINRLRVEVAGFQAKLEEAEYIASSDSLTGLRSRLYVEEQFKRRIDGQLRFCVAIIDIDGFKRVNDENGHLAGDELLKQFTAELKAACRAADIVGRWGGDEFIILLDSGMQEAKAQIDRLREWVCGNYTVHRESSPVKLRVQASIGLAEYLPGEALKALLARADAEMYQEKAASRDDRNRPRR